MIVGRKGDGPATTAALTKVVNLIDLLPPKWLARHEQVLMVAALSHHRLGNREKAREYLRTIIARNGRNVAAGKLLASIYLEKRDYSAAAPVLEALQRVAPDDAQVQFMLGSVRLYQKRYLAATDLLEKAAAQSGSSQMKRALALSQLGSGPRGTRNRQFGKAIRCKSRR